MSLVPGTRLGPYEVTGAIGAGGMGEVYRARDTKLGRDVALKVLPEAFASDAERMARFEREAKVLASLNHPNIAAIYGFEESSGAGSPARAPLRALVMELVEGPTLADRIVQGPIPLDEALPIAKQIAEGLEYAHERGIVHRDLKPANVKITPDGMVKLLDFGLAKALEDEASPADTSNSPTLTMAATKAGVILGTAAYMSPEQARGSAADRRSDIWSFGVVLYEMLTGKPCFSGNTVSDTLAAVLRDQISLDALPADVPPPIRKLLRRCLERDRKRRLRDIGEARIAIEDYLVNPAEASVADVTPVPAVAAPLVWRRALPWVAAGLLAAALVAVVVAWRMSAPAAVAPSVTNLDLDMGKLSLAFTYGSRVVISPDGRKMVFLATESGSQTRQLYLRSMDSEGITPLPGTQGALNPFFSPDGQWVGFSANGKLEKVPLSGGLPVTLCDAAGIYGMAATWADNGSIYFTSGGKVKRIPEGGGTPQAVAAAPDPDKLTYGWISALPGSRGLLLTAVSGGYSEFDIDVLSLETGKTKRLIENGSWPLYLPTGQIVYEQYSTAEGGFTGGLLAVPFDLKSLAVTGSPVPVMEGVATGLVGGGFYDVAADGTMVYAPGSGTVGAKRLAWLDSNGKVDPLPAPQGNYVNLTASPDGKHVAMQKITGSSSDIYIYDLNRNTMQRLTFNGRSSNPVFTPDGSHVIYDSASAKGEVDNLWMRTADGSGNAERLTTSKFTQGAGSVSPDGKLLTVGQTNPKTGHDIYVMPLKGNGKPQIFLRTPHPYVAYGAMFSPDGKWITYFSDESGTFQVYVQAFPGPGGKYQISTGTGGGAHNPVWSHDGKKLYYEQGDGLMEVDVTTRPTFSAGTPRVVGKNLGIAQAAQNFAVTPDGRILIAQRVQQSGQSQQGSSLLHVVLNFASGVQSRFSAGKQ